MKLVEKIKAMILGRRSPKGAWIEMEAVMSKHILLLGRYRKGAWIEIGAEQLPS